MVAATVNTAAIALSVGPMLDGWFNGERTGSGTIVWKAREMLAKGEINAQGFIKLVAPFPTYRADSGDTASQSLVEVALTAHHGYGKLSCHRSSGP